MNTIANATNRLLGKSPADISNDRTRLASPSDSAPPLPANLNYACLPNLPKEQLSTCSIDNNEETKLIFPKFSRRFNTLRDLPAPQASSGKTAKSFSEFRPVRAFASPKFQTPCAPMKGLFMRPASRRLAEFSGKVVSNFSFTNCFFETNTNKVALGPEPQLKRLWPFVGSSNGPIGSNLAVLGLGAGGEKKAFKAWNDLDQRGSKNGPELKNSKALEGKRSKKQSALSIKNNFSFRKIGPECGLNLEVDSNAHGRPGQLIKPKTKRICKAKDKKLDLLYRLIRQVVRQERRLERVAELEVVNHSSVLYQPGFFFHAENRVFRRRRNLQKKGIFLGNYERNLCCFVSCILKLVDFKFIFLN